MLVVGESITGLTILGSGLVASGFALLERKAIVDVAGFASSVGRP